MQAKGNAKRTWAAALAAVLAVAIVLTGTLAWKNMTQKVGNEFLKDKNPGGRMHDDFNGEENKDIYAENFTDTTNGAPVYVRVRLLEYMETGEDAGINRTVVPEDGGDPIPNPDRKATPLVEGADINDKTTWYLHKPLAEGETDPFHDYWEWEMGGQTTYMPTFNKNKDSISVDVNGTYVGTDKDFETGEPYDDYVTYTDGQESEELPAYYDADGDNDVDEWQTDPDKDTKAPGSGGVKKDPEADPPVLEGNYEVKKEKHTAQKTLNGLGIITMKEWKEAEMPVCNKWVWDTDGWFYWPEPVMPQTATGLLLTKVTQIEAPSEKCYYVIEMEGQFIDSVKESGLGKPEIKDGDTVTQEATGFYVDGVTPDAIALLTQAATKVKVGEDNNWYLQMSDHHIFKQIMDDEGTLGDDLIWWGEDKKLGTEDDRSDVLYHEGGVTIGGTHYGDYFLPPRTEAPYEENYYQSAGPDGEFGTNDDVRLWLPAGGTFPDDLLDKVVDTVTVNIPEGVTELGEGENKYIEVEVGTTLANAFTADVKLGENPAMDTAVTWSVKATDGKKLADGTTIDGISGVLTVDENETPRFLTVTAASKLDNRQKGTYTVKVYGKVNVKITLASGAALSEIQAGKTMELKATLYRGDEFAPNQPDTFTWSATNTPAATLSLRAVTPDVDAVQMDNGLLTVGRKLSGTVTVTAQCAVGSETQTGTLVLNITPADAVTVTLGGGAASIEPGDTTGVTFTATLTNTEELEDTGVDWTVGKSSNNGEDIETITGVNITDGKLVLPADYSITDNGTTLWVKATAKDSSTNNAWKATSISVIAPTKINIAREDGKELKTIKNDGVAVTLTAKVMKSDNTQYKGSQEVTWWAGNSSGGTISGVTIDENTGALTVASSVAVDTEITVKATSKVKTGVVGTVTVTAWDGKIEIDGGTVTYDGINYIILTKDTANNRQLILSKDSVGVQKFNTDRNNAKWSGSNVQSWLNNTWLPTQTQLNAALADPSGTTIKTRTDAADPTSHDTTNDKVFLLSEADVYGTVNGIKPVDDDYTAGGQFKWKTGGNEKWVAKWNNSAPFWWLRSLCSSYSVAFVNDSGDLINDYPTTEYGVRPACWVKINP